ncbi:hypothetical protein Tco_0478457 [Tanacetum coccineum]
MDSDKYLEGQSMQRPPLFESDSFIYWKNRFETYVKSKDLDLWHVITNGDFQPIIQNPKTKLDERDEIDRKVKDETCLIAHASSEICLGVDLEPNEWIKDIGCSKHMTGNRKLFSTYKAYNGVMMFWCNSSREITKGKVIGRGIRKKRLILQMKKGNKPKIKICLATIDENSTLWHRRLGKSKNHLIWTFDETPPPAKTSPLVDDDLDEEEAIREIEKKNLENNVEDETLEIDEVVNIKESRNHPLEKCQRKLTKEP